MEEEENWRIPDLNWNEGLTAVQQAKAMMLRGTRIINYNLLFGTLGMVGLVPVIHQLEALWGVSVMHVLFVVMCVFCGLVYMAQIKNEQTFETWRLVEAGGAGL